MVLMIKNLYMTVFFFTVSFMEKSEMVILFWCVCLCFSRAAVADGGLSVRMKYHVYSVLANISAALPCISDWSSGLPRVTG